MEQVQLDRLVAELEGSFGEELPFSSGTLSVAQLEVLAQVFGDEGYQSYLQDQVNRQIIRDFLVNAVLLGHLSQYEVSAITPQITNREGRAALSLHMLMSSVEHAAELVNPGEAESLNRLKPVLKLPPYIKLIHS